MGILLQYNEATSYTWQELLERTGLSSDVLQGQLGVLMKAKVLLQDKDKYDLNMDFKSKKIRVNLNMPVKSEQKAESEETHKTVEEDRKLLIQVHRLCKQDLLDIGCDCTYHEDTESHETCGIDARSHCSAQIPIPTPRPRHQKDD